MTSNFYQTLLSSDLGLGHALVAVVELFLPAHQTIPGFLALNPDSHSFLHREAGETVAPKDTRKEASKTDQSQTTGKYLPCLSRDYQLTGSSGGFCTTARSSRQGGIQGQLIWDAR